MKRVMVVTNNKIYAKRNGSFYDIAVRDTSKKTVSKNKTCRIIYDGNALKVVDSDFDTARTTKMLGLVERNMKFVKRVL